MFQPCLCWNRKVDLGKEQDGDRALVDMVRLLSPPPHIMSIGMQTHSETIHRKKIQEFLMLQKGGLNKSCVTRCHTRQLSHAAEQKQMQGNHKCQHSEQLIVHSKDTNS